MEALLTGLGGAITKRLLAGGRQEGVEVIEVDNGLMKFTVVPTRGFQRLDGQCRRRPAGMGLAGDGNRASSICESGGARRSWLAEWFR